ncbi:MAG: polysaccharide biosynthesis/export family protein [Selenomonadaceae bacterium]|nr:polysaccharide biosynthesis/export family protein [Selenomonadaceae bacterium]
MKSFFQILAIFSVVLVTGCLQRSTTLYKSFPELEYDPNAVLEEGELDEAERQKQIEALKELERKHSLTYTINAGDVISIVVYDHGELNIQTKVTPDGYIGMVFVGQLKVEGMTLKEAGEALEKALEKYIRNPKVGISPVQILSENATIAGAVNKPGMYTLSNGMRLADLFAMAGGANIRRYDGKDLEAVDYEHSVFMRGEKQIFLDFNKAIKQGDRLHNVLLSKGDYIFLASKDNSMVYVIGDVGSPRSMIWNKNLGLLEVLTESGWLKETYWRHAIIIRGGFANPRLYKVDLDGILHGRKGNVMVDASDVIYLPKDDISEYNVFVRKLLPTGQLINLLRSLPSK